MNELRESAQRQSELVDQIAEVAFQRGKITKRLEVNSKLIKALENNLLDFHTFKLVETILSEE